MCICEKRGECIENSEQMVAFFASNCRPNNADLKYFCFLHWFHSIMFCFIGAVQSCLVIKRPALDLYLHFLLFFVVRLAVNVIALYQDFNLALSCEESS